MVLVWRWKRKGFVVLVELGLRDMIGLILIQQGMACFNSAGCWLAINQFRVLGGFLLHLLELGFLVR